MMEPATTPTSLLNLESYIQYRYCPFWTAETSYAIPSAFAQCVLVWHIITSIMYDLDYLVKICHYL